MIIWTLSIFKAYSQTNLLTDPVLIESYQFNDPTLDDSKRDIFFDFSEIKNSTENTKLDILQCVNFFGVRLDPFLLYNLRDASWNKNINVTNFEPFPNNFYFASSTIKYKGVISLKMRNINPQKNDVVVLRDDAVQVYWNVNYTISGTLKQNIPLSGGSILIKGNYDADDNVEDVIIYTNPNLKIYKNLSSGLLDSSPLPNQINVGNLSTFPEIISAQINGQTFPQSQYSDPFGANKYDIIVKDDQNIRIYLNDNNNNAYLSQTISTGIQLYSMAVGDINNDGYNDIIYCGNNILKIHLNNPTSGINPSPDIVISNSNLGTIKAVGIGDFNSDGMNDLVLGLNYAVSIFLNTAEQNYFNNNPTQTISGNNFISESKGIRVVDLYNQGGLAVIVKGTGPISENILTPWEYDQLYRFNAIERNPAPAPAIVYKSSQYQGGLLRPKIYMYSKGERDFIKYRIYKQSPNTNNILVQIAETTNNTYVDYTEFITASTNGDQATIHNCFYKVRVIDATNKESNNSSYLGYTVGGIPTCIACEDGIG